MSVYDTHAHEYAVHTATNVYNTHYERPALQAQLGDVRGKRVLDAGCASGEHTALLLERGAEVTAVDASASLVAIVRERFGRRVRAERADLREPLTFLDDASIDIVMSSLTLHYLEDWSLPLREFARVLVPGGRLVLSTHHPSMTAPMATNYFRTELVNDVWRMNGHDVEVQFFHRPMEAIVTPFLNAGFTLDALVEPHLAEPDPAIPPQTYERLSSEPTFLILKAHRP
ncbi:MAG: class I SAM-dependent methyltransferase [Vulcanimicrobiaceae bacterium]